MTKINIERRYYTLDADTQFRAEETEDGKKFIFGYAAVYNKRSNLLFDWEKNTLFTEIIEPGAFDKALSRADLDVTLNFQHSDNYLMARNKGGNGSLELGTDDVGLYFRTEVPNTSYAQDIWNLIKRGDLDSNSFAFIPAEDAYRWEETDNEVIGYLNEVEELRDVSVVVHPAYNDTELGARSKIATRSYEAYKESKKEPEIEEPNYKKDQRARKLKLLKIK